MLLVVQGCPVTPTPSRSIKNTFNATSLVRTLALPSPLSLADHRQTTFGRQPWGLGLPRLRRMWTPRPVSSSSGRSPRDPPSTLAVTSPTAPSQVPRPRSTCHFISPLTADEARDGIRFDFYCQKTSCWCPRDPNTGHCYSPQSTGFHADTSQRPSSETAVSCHVAHLTFS